MTPYDTITCEVCGSKQQLKDLQEQRWQIGAMGKVRWCSKKCVRIGRGLEPPDEDAQAPPEDGSISAKQTAALLKRMAELRDRFEPYSVPWCRADNIIEMIRTAQLRTRDGK